MAYYSEKEMPKAIDLTHHLSDVAKAREASPLKGLMKYFGKPGMISLAGGKCQSKSLNFLLDSFFCRLETQTQSVVNCF